jgi:RNA polymerase sigma factor (sigma-70 family)
MAMLPVQAPHEQGSVHEIRPRLTGRSSRGLAGRSDERLVSVAKEGDERAFEILYERHSPAIHRYCRSLLRSTQEAEDVKQEVFVLAISALRRGAAPDAFRPWLYRVAHNACMSHLRMRRPVLVADNGVLVGPAAAAEPVQHHREELRQLLDDIGNLPDVQRGALLLREMDGFSYEQVGEVLGLPLSTVRASIFRARRTLQGLAEARDADCEVIQSELCELADRRGRRGRHITSHLTVCSSCRDFRDGLRRRQTVLGGVAPIASGGLLLALKGKLLGGAAAAGGAGTAVATAGGGAGVAKIAAVAASSIALLAGAGVEADRAIEHGRRDAAVTPSHSAVARTAGATTGAAARTTVRRTPAGITLAAPDSLREGRLVAERARDALRAGTGVRVHAAPAKRRTTASATPRATTTATAAAPPAAPAAAPPGAVQQPPAPATARTNGDAQHPGTAGRGRDVQHGARRGDDAKRGTKAAGGAPAADRAEGPPEHASPRADAGNDKASDSTGTPGAGDASGPPTGGRSQESSGPPVPAPQAGGSGGAPDAPATPGTPASPAPGPAPDPAGPPSGVGATPVDPPVDPPAGDAGTASVTTADPAGVTVLTQP